MTLKDTLGNQRFELTEDLVKLLRHSHVRSGTEFGAAEIDGKRPYGNSNVEADMALILGVELVDGVYLREADQERLSQLHKQTPRALQIVLASGSFEPGVYEATNYDTDWKRIDV